jgi:hypothetical protein
MRLRWLALALSAVTGAVLLVVAAAQAQAPPPDTVAGVVVDAAGPVAGATVRVRATAIAATTDAAGRFALTDLPPGEAVDLTAWAPGYYITGGQSFLPGTDGVVLTLIPHSDVDNADYEWLSAFASAGADGNCENCHASTGASGTATLPFDEWSADAHAQSVHNPRFLTMYAGTDLDGNQSPTTRYGHSRDYGRFPLPPDPAQPYYGPGYKLDFPDTAGNCAACHAPVAAINAPYSTDPTQISGVGTEGVACDFCHKIWDVRLDPAAGLPYANMPGVLSLAFRRPPESHQLFAGPYDDVGFAGSEDTYSPLQTASALCAACHFGTFWNTTIYNSFGEWLASPYSDPGTGKTCQDCHMPPLGATRIANHDQARDRDPATIFSHQMPGAADENLLQNTAELHVTAKQVGDQIIVTVEVTNTQAGHHIPTDSPLRQIFLVVTATDAQGRAQPQVAGPVLPSWAGDLQGASGVYFAKILQEIWTEVTPTGAYWNPTRIVEDTRLPALGTNVSTYTFAVPEAADPVTVEAHLIFRRAFYDLMQQKGWDVPDIVMEQAVVQVYEEGVDDR